VPLTEEYARRAITLPLFASITEAQIGLVTEALAEAL
jgi:dTDP-4-amino-4,6-dideoxygalactose transaminase